MITFLFFTFLHDLTPDNGGEGGGGDEEEEEEEEEEGVGGGGGGGILKTREAKNFEVLFLRGGKKKVISGDYRRQVRQREKGGVK